MACARLWGKWVGWWLTQIRYWEAMSLTLVWFALKCQLWASCAHTCLSLVAPAMGQKG